MFAQVLTDWLTSITALAASVAAVVAGLNLWYNALSGPDIKLVRKPDSSKSDFNLHDVPADDSAIPPTVELSPSFIFVNSGSTTGIIKLRLSFSPSPALEALDCCNRFTVAFENERGGQTKDMPYLSLQKREQRIVETKLFIELGDWKSYVPQSDEAKGDSICTTLLKADKGNKERYRNFCELLKNNRSLGTLSVYSSITQRQRGKGRRIFKREDVIDDTSLSVEEPIGIDDESIQNFTKYYDNWNYVQPRFVELFQEVEQRFERIFSTQGLYQTLLEQINEDTGTVKTWNKLWDSAWSGSAAVVSERYKQQKDPMRYILAFIFKSSGLDFKMGEFSEKADEFNQVRGFWNQAQPRGDNQYRNLKESMEQLRSELVAMNKQIQDIGESVAEELKRCVEKFLTQNY